MLREKASVINGIHRMLDLIVTGIAFNLAYLFKKTVPLNFSQGLSSGPDYRLVFFIVIVVWYFALEFNDNYSSFREKTFLKIIIDLYKSVILAVMIFSVFIYFFKIQDISRGLMLIFISFDVFLLSLSKFIIYRFLNSIRKKGYNHRNIIVVGSKTRAVNFIKSVLDNADKGYKISGCIEIEESMVGRHITADIYVSDHISRLQNILETQIVDEIVFAMPLRKIVNGDKYIAMAEDMGVKCRIIPDWQLHYLIYKPDVATIRFESFLGVPTMALHMITNRDCLLVYKNLIDYILCGISFVILLPIFGIIGLLIKIFSKGPVFYKQKRVGLNGRIFNVYKFRTMVQNADKMLEKLKKLNEADGPAFKIKKDPRVIPYIGSFLRKTSLDELPQIINVLRGEMSLVGPRPPLPSEVKEYEIWQRRRLSMKPGLTCIWQISPGRNDIKFNEWMKMDLDYIDNWSLWLDFKLVFKTLKSVLTGAGR